jgi:hypothetical protein
MSKVDVTIAEKTSVSPKKSNLINPITNAAKKKNIQM